MNTDLWRDATPKRSRWVRPPAVTLVVYAVVLVGIGWFFLYTATGQLVDQLALLGAGAYNTDPAGGMISTVVAKVTGVTGHVVALAGPAFIVVTILVVVGLTLWRRAWSLGLGAVVVLAGANLTTQAFKAWWDRPDLGLYQTYGNSWPSGHTTLVASAVLAVLLVAAPRLRWVVATVGWIFVTMMAWGTFTHGWHRPSDTVAAICVSAVWYVLVETIRRSVAQVPFEQKVDNRVATRVHDVLAGISAAVGLGILAAVVIIMPDGPVEGVDEAVQRLAFVGAFFGIAAAAIATSRLLLTVGPREDEPQM